MQLKRDTDYAIRILLVMAESAQSKKELQILSLKTICEKISAPGQVTLRLCNLLSDEGYIKKEEIDGNTAMYMPEEKLFDTTLLDIIHTVEGQSDLFAVFDRRAEVYEKYGPALASVNEVVSDELSKITIQSLLNRKQQTYIPSHSTFLNRQTMKVLNN